MESVYHGSSRSGLRVILPVVSTHGKPLVYACKDTIMAALFLSGRGGDLTCQLGRDRATSRPYLCERFAGAAEYRYAATRGSIYTLPGESFRAGQTSWDEEVVSAVKVRPTAESMIEDVMRHLEQLQAHDLLRIYRYPARPRGVPQDDEDLVMRGVVWTRERGEAILEQFRSYHPHLLERIEQGLADGRYADEFHGDRGP